MKRSNRDEISVVLLSTLLALLGCGSSDGGNEATLGDEVIGHSSCGDGCSSLDFSQAAAGSHWIVTPYILGDSSVIAGAGPTTFDFAVEGAAPIGSSEESPQTSAGLNSQVDSGLSHSYSRPILSIGTRDHALRSLYNHFSPHRGLNQPSWFWPAVADLDRKLSTREAPGLRFVGPEIDLKPTVKDEFLGQLVSSHLQGKQAVSSKNQRSPASTAPTLPSTRLTPKSIIPGSVVASRFVHRSPEQEPLQLQGEVGCPTSGKVPVPAPTGAYDAGEEAAIVQKFEGEDFCLAVLSDLKTAGTMDEVAEAMVTIMKRYKDTIYKDQMAPKGAFTMAPLVIVADFKDDFVWPPAEEGKLQVSGVLHRGVTEALGRPVIYIASDLVTVLGLSGEQASKAKQLWYGTLAHEIQHGVMYYYREAQGQGVGETPAVDEGVAHFMEDVFGYGLENFKSYAGAFLSVHPFGTAPFLDSGPEVISNDTLRGATHTLLYYLASQMGGVEFSGGEVSGGGGLDFIVNIVKRNSSAGAATLKAAYGSDWSQVIADYSNALVVDGNGKDGMDSRFSTQKPVANVTQIGGGAGTYGMRFNGYAGLTSNLGTYELLGEGVPGVKHYHLKPYRMVVEDPTVPLKFKLQDDIANTGVTAIKVR